MIMGVDHIALSCKNIEEAYKYLIAIGYRLKFTFHNLSNHPAKIKDLKQYHPLQTHIQ